MEAEQLVIAIDCSTTAVKAVVFDKNGNALAISKYSLSLESPKPGWQEQDANQWWKGLCYTVKEALSKIDASKVKSLSITHQRESFVCLDENAKIIRPAILWLDIRASEQIKALGNEKIEQISGKPADVTPAFYKIAWLKDNEPETLNKTHKLLDVHAYLVYKLCGEYITSTASADPLGLLDIESRNWSKELISILGLKTSQLPSLCDAGDLLPNIKADILLELGLPSDISFIAGLGDGQAAGLGANIIGPNVAYLNLGTAALIGCDMPAYKSSRNYRSLVSPVKNHITAEALLSSGTYLPTWFRKEFGAGSLNGEPDAQLEQSAAEVGIGAGGLMLLPYWNAAQTPHWDSTAAGAIIGWRGGHGKAHFYRAILEGVALELKAQLMALEKYVSNISTIRIMGGGSRSTLWRQIIADVLGVELIVCTQSEISALGAAVLSFKFLEKNVSLEEITQRMTQFGDSIAPDIINTHKYEKLFDIYKDYYPSLKSISTRLSELKI